MQFILSVMGKQVELQMKYTTNTHILFEEMHSIIFRIH